MRCPRAAIISAIPFGLALLVFPVMCSPSAGSTYLILFLAAILGALLASLYQRRMRTQLSLRIYTLLGAAVGCSAALVYFTSGTILFAVLTGRHIVLNTAALEQVVLGTLTFSVASGAGGLLVGLLGKSKASTKEFH